MSQAASVPGSGIPGYTYGTAAVPRAPVTLEELELLKKTCLLYTSPSPRD